MLNKKAIALLYSLIYDRIYGVGGAFPIYGQDQNEYCLKERTLQERDRTTGKISTAKVKAYIEDPHHW